MKKFRLFYVILISLVIFSSCSSNDDDKIIISQTFLEKNDGTVWQWIGDEIEYVRLKNNEAIPAEIWDYYPNVDEGCYEHYLFDLNEFSSIPDVTVNVTGHSEDIYEVTIAMTDYVEIVSLQIDGDVLSIEMKEYEYGELKYTYIETYERQNIDVDNLIICDDI